MEKPRISVPVALLIVGVGQVFVTGVAWGDLSRRMQTVEAASKTSVSANLVAQMAATQRETDKRQDQLLTLALGRIEQQREVITRLKKDE